MFLSLLVLIEVVFLGIAAVRGGLVATMVVNMSAITLFGGAMIAVGPWSTNAGNVCYMAVMAAQALILSKHTESTISSIKRGLQSIEIVFFAMAFMAAIRGMIWLFADTSTILGMSYRTLIQASWDFLLPAWAAFWIGQGAFLGVYGWMEGRAFWQRYAVAVVIAQCVDSLVFFPLAFGLSAPTVEIMLAGAAVKIALGLAITPLLVFSSRLSEHIRK